MKRRRLICLNTYWIKVQMLISMLDMICFSLQEHLMIQTLCLSLMVGFLDLMLMLGVEESLLFLHQDLSQVKGSFQWLFMIWIRLVNISLMFQLMFRIIWVYLILNARKLLLILLISILIKAKHLK